MSFTVRVTTDYQSDQTLKFDLIAPAVATGKALADSKVFKQVEVEMYPGNVIWATYPLEVAETPNKTRNRIVRRAQRFSGWRS